MDRKIILAPSTLALCLGLASCGGGAGGNDGTTQIPPPAPKPTAVEVSPCLNQTVFEGRSVAQLVIPDVLQLDMNQPSGFPNGRKLQDPVVDVTLAVLFLDLKTQSAATFANLPLDPKGNDIPQPATFPYLASAQGTMAPPSGVGSGFVFRTDAPAAYTRVDRMGMPAVATALIDSSHKTAYNDDNPTIDATGKWAPTIKDDLTVLTTALIGQFRSLGLNPCATGG
jgi:hypothetical protein